MVGGRAGILARGQLQHGPDGVFAEVQRRFARDAGGDRDVRDLCAGDEPYQSGIWNGMERCGRGYSVDFMDSDGRPGGGGSELGCDEEVSRGDSRSESGLFVEEKLWNSFC